MVKRYVFMIKDELGCERRAHGTEFLSGVHDFPSFDREDKAMQAAFEAWKDSLLERGQKEWETTFGPECKVFLERRFVL